MDIAQARTIADDALTQLAQLLEQGHSEALQRYLALLARFHAYSYGNVLLIRAQRPEATHVAGFHAWRRLGRQVKRGERGIAIIAPIACRPVVEAPASDDVVVSTPLRFRLAYVFDVSQTTGGPLPEFARVLGDPGVHVPQLRALIARHGIALEYAPVLGGANGVSWGGRIQIRTGLSPAEEFRVLTHELAHELLHKGDRRRDTSTTQRETEAEAVAYVVCQAIGLENGSRSADYIQLYAGDRAVLAASLALIQRTAAAIIAAVLSPPTPTCPEAATAQRA